MLYRLARPPRPTATARFTLYAAVLALLALPARAQTPPSVLPLASANPEASGFFGWSVAGVPDTDGDGVEDLLVGASGENVVGASNAGRSYLYSGAAGALLFTLDSPNPEALGEFGSAVAHVPDADGDAVNDLLIGAPFEDVSGATDAGRAYLFSGATGAPLRTLASPNVESDGHFGSAVAGVPDADGDGFGDLLVGASLEDGGPDGAGRAYLLSGGTGALRHTLVSPNADVSGRFGYAVSGVLDADGDGRGDLLVGAEWEDVGGVNSVGRAYFPSGATGALLLTLESPNPVEEGYFGFSATGLGDVDGDGNGDFAVGAALEDGGARHAGRAYLYYGADFTAEPPLTLTLTPTNPPPPVVLRRGERLRYRADFTAAPDGPTAVEYWVGATFPNGAVRPLFGPLTVALVQGGTVSLNFQQRVPGNAPFGEYTLTMYAGTYPSEVLASDRFPVTVTNAAPLLPDSDSDDTRAAYDEAGHVLGASTVAQAAGDGLETGLLAPTPNPTSGWTTLRFTLGTAGPVRLSVYDALGRGVAVLADDAREAGEHEAAFDASALAPGVYLVRLEASALVASCRLTVLG